MSEVSDLKRGGVVLGGGSHTRRRGSVDAPGIGAETVGSRAVVLGMVTVAPEGRTTAPLPQFREFASCPVRGEAVRVCAGARLDHRETARAGDDLFMPANVPHAAVNRGRSPAVFTGVRNEPTALEGVVMVTHLDGLVP